MSFDKDVLVPGETYWISVIPSKTNHVPRVYCYCGPAMFVGLDSGYFCFSYPINVGRVKSGREIYLFGKEFEVRKIGQ